jgi:hypothetical protein
MLLKKVIFISLNSLTYRAQDMEVLIAQMINKFHSFRVTSREPDESIPLSIPLTSTPRSHMWPLLLAFGPTHQNLIRISDLILLDLITLTTVSKY